MDNLLINNAETAYTLGILWSDGYLCKHSNGKYYSVCIRIDHDDLQSIKNVLLKSIIRNWKFYNYKNKNYKVLSEAQSHSINLCNMLLKVNFHKKSYISHEHIFSIIPDNLQKYYIRGLIDGDGCFYIRKSKTGQTFSISSTYDQDWSYLAQYFSNKLGIIGKITKSINKKGNKSSVFFINRREDIVKLGSFVYNGIENDHIGFPRKYNKFLIIKNLYENPPKFSKYNKCYKGVYLKNIKTNEVIEINTMENFCNKYKLDQSGIRNVLKGKYLQWKSWVLPDADISNISKIKYENFSNKISKTYIFLYKGKEITIKNINRYCRENGLSYSGFKPLIRGEKSEYRGYKFIKKL